MSHEFARGHAAAHGYDSVQMGDTRYTWGELLDEVERASARTDRGKIGSADLYVKDADPEFAVMEEIATVALSYLDIDHTGSFYDDSTGEVVQEAVGDDALELYEHDTARRNSSCSPEDIRARIGECLQGADAGPRVSPASFYDAFTAKYVLGDDDIGGNMLDDGRGRVQAIDFKFGGRPIEAVDQHVRDRASDAADYLDIDFSRDRFYNHIEDRVEHVDTAALERSIVTRLGPRNATEHREQIDTVIQNIEDIRDGKLWEIYAADQPGPGAT